MSSPGNAVITGRGVLSPLGCDWPSFAAAVRARAAPSIGSFPDALMDDSAPCHLLSDPEALVPTGSGRAAEPLGALATAAARQALTEAGISVDGSKPLDDVGLVMNTVLGPSGAVEAYLERLQDRGPRASRPAHFVDTLLSMPGSRVGMAFRLRGSTAVLGGSSAFELALDWVRRGREPSIVAGGGEYQSPKCLRYHRVLVERSGAERPHLAQGAAFLVLEAPQRAERRGAASLGVVLGAGAASEPQNVALPWSTDTDGRAFALAMRAALADAALQPGAVQAVALAAGDDASEVGELAAVRAVFGEVTNSLSLLRPKRLLGEALGASAGLGVLAALAEPAAGAGPAVMLVNAFEMGGAVTSLVVRGASR